jgi:hypothetical protein
MLQMLLASMLKDWRRTILQGKHVITTSSVENFSNGYDKN